ncbi:hypothetical protein [Pseudogulbenkiania subflava]|uniref:Uncharacterized protein n=1 Tax=Pseudogulbenkiania subflava DSM 22618 TaxID=1123014 RepID=A0A1Y6BWH3_9NEIS|nr:hypothetical protein [Pseudogulbenkiania subflava]SMF23086.1 hypothetical protein SAMN02745746_02016 [Pseudogulbenkiania subflava DSM 22618]SMF32423.1 hypothetical protein SAMN02745746_02564 [Pseudogulbenkiania subflava DSM 22618]SMF47514.1 hypothetical protein SAMN02745746_03493 [Pseudogulbenkiania subflava DSM 22618]
MTSGQAHPSSSPSESTARGTTLHWLALLSSSGTLVCCAVPILLVSIGLGATVATMTSALPLLVTLAAHKAWLFAGSAMLLALAGYATFRTGRACPADPTLAAACQRAQRLSVRLFWLSLAIWGIGFLTAYLALPIRIWLGY